MTALSLADRLRVYAATSTDGNVTLTMDVDAAHELIRLVEAAEVIVEEVTHAHFEAQARLAREASTNRMVMWQACYLAAVLAFWGIIA